MRIGLVHPHFLPGLGIERHDGVVCSQDIRKSVRLDRIEKVPVVITRWKHPGDLKLVNIGPIDLAKSGVLRRVWSAAVVAPCCAVLAKGANVSAQHETA